MIKKASEQMMRKHGYHCSEWLGTAVFDAVGRRGKRRKQKQQAVNCCITVLKRMIYVNKECGSIETTLQVVQAEFRISQ